MDVDAIIFVGAIIAGATQAIKYVVPQVNGAVTIAVAAIVGVAVALADTSIGLTDITVAQGIMAGLATVGVVTTASKIAQKVE